MPVQTSESSQVNELKCIRCGHSYKEHCDSTERLATVGCLHRWDENDIDRPVLSMLRSFCTCHAFQGGYLANRNGTGRTELTGFGYTVYRGTAEKSMEEIIEERVQEIIAKRSVIRTPEQVEGRKFKEDLIVEEL